MRDKEDFLDNLKVYLKVAREQKVTVQSNETEVSNRSQKMTSPEIVKVEEQKPINQP